jgi:hypothetical protein
MTTLGQNDLIPPRSPLASILAFAMVGVFVAAIAGVLVSAWTPPSHSKAETAQRQAATPSRS